MNVAQTRSFSPEYSGILPTTMALQSQSGSGRSNVGTLPDWVDCTPAARQIQAVGGISYSTFILLNKTLWLYRYNRNIQRIKTMEVIDVQYTAIIKDGGLFIPNVFSDLNDGNSHIVQVAVDIEEVRQQLNSSAVAKMNAPRPAKKPVKNPARKTTKKEVQKAAEVDATSLSKSAIDELEGLDDSELSEIFKAYMNDGQQPTQISLENL